MLTQTYEADEEHDSLATPSDERSIVFSDSFSHLERTMAFLTMEKDVIVESINGTAAICGCGGMRRNLVISQTISTSIIDEAEELPNSVCGKRKFGVM